MALAAWAVPQLAALLPLDQNSLKDIVAYNESLPKQAAAENLKTLLGDTPKALEFIASFNSRRAASNSTTTVTPSEVPVRRARKSRDRSKEPINKGFDVRKPENYGGTHGSHVTSHDDEYIPAVAKPKAGPKSTSIFTPGPGNGQTADQITEATHAALPVAESVDGRTLKRPQPSKVKVKVKQDTKIRVPGGVSMHGQASTISDLDSAIRSLEIQTNPTLRDTQKDSDRRCDCMATRHALLNVAPNCLNCGKIICVKEGLGPCTFCHQPLLTGIEIQEMMKVLVAQRGKEKMEANNASHKRAEVSKTPRPFSSNSFPANTSTISSTSDAEGLAIARRHRDKLLQFQAENASRTRIHDEASDFETPDAGLSMWASTQERALQLKRQQKVLREQEWNAKPEYEKRRQVISIDLVGKKAIRRIVDIGHPEITDGEETENAPADQETKTAAAFSRNPLLGNLIRPIYPGLNSIEQARGHHKNGLWRRVQDDSEDNEKWMLDGFTLGHAERADVT